MTGSQSKTPELSPARTDFMHLVAENPMAEQFNDAPRTHEPTLRELTAELDGIKKVTQSKLDSIKELVNERHERYGERFSAQEAANVAAIAANKELAVMAFTTVEKATTVSNQAQQALIERTNELRDTLNECIGHMVTTGSADARFSTVNGKIEDYKILADNKVAVIKQELDKRVDELKSEIGSLREFRSSSSGFREAEELRDSQRNFLIGLFVTAILSVIGLAISVIQFLKH